MDEINTTKYYVSLCLQHDYVKILHLLLLSLQLFVNSRPQQHSQDFTAASASVVTPGIPTCTEKREGGGEAGGGGGGCDEEE